MVDDSKKIIEEYVRVSETCETHLMGLISELTDKFNELPVAIKTLAGIKESNLDLNGTDYKFSSILKAYL